MQDNHPATPQRPSLPPLMEMTENAVSRLRALYAGAQKGKTLRISVSNRGCSGKSYEMDFVDAPNPGDESVVKDDVRLFVDRKATLFLIGTVMDFEAGMMQSGFTFSNPNEKGRCGCGESFFT